MVGRDVVVVEVGLVVGLGLIVVIRDGLVVVGVVVVVLGRSVGNGKAPEDSSASQKILYPY